MSELSYDRELYSPQLEQAAEIIRNDYFRRLYSANLEAGDSPGRAARKAFMAYLWGEGAFYGNLSIPEKNTVAWVTSQFTTADDTPEPKPLGPDLFTDLIPDAFKAAYEGATEGRKQFLKYALIFGGIALTAYTLPKIIEAANAAQKLAKA